MKQVLFLILMVFLLGSCHKYELISEGNITEISDTTATINGKSYKIDGGTTDFLLGNQKIEVGNKGFIYSYKDNYYISGINKKQLSTYSSEKIGYQIALIIQLMLLFVLMMIWTDNNTTGENSTCILLCTLMIIPLIFMILGRYFPDNFPKLKPTSEVEFLDYGKLTHQTDKIKTINQKEWPISNNYPKNNDQEELKVGKTYAVVSHRGQASLYLADNEQQIRKEISYYNQENAISNTEVGIILISICSIFYLIILSINASENLRHIKSGPQKSLNIEKEDEYDDGYDDGDDEEDDESYENKKHQTKHS